MNKDTAKLLLDVLKGVEENPQAKPYGFTKEEVIEIVHGYFPNDEELLENNSLEDRVNEAKRLLNAILGLSQEEAEKLSQTVPTNLKELEAQLEEIKQSQEEGKSVVSESQHQQVASWIERARKKRIEEKPVEEDQLEQEEAAFFQKTQEISERPEILNIFLSPTSASLEKFTSNIISAPLKFIIDLGASEIHKASPSVSTAVWLMAQGVTSSSISQIAAAARQKGVSLSYKKLKNLESLIKEHEGITIYKILQKARELQFTQADEAALIQVFLPSEEVKAPSGKQGFSIRSSIAEEASSLPQETYTQGLAGTLAETALGKASSEVLKRTLGKSAQGLVVKGLTKLGLQALATATVPVVGNVVAFITTELLSLGKRLVSWLARVLSGKEKGEFGKILPVGLVVGGLALFPFFPFLSPVLVLSGILSGVGAASIPGKAAGFFNNLFSGITRVVIPSVAAPIAITLVTVPIVVALIIFIINSSAYIVPPNLDGLPGTTIVPPDDISASGTCPIPGGVNICGSYGSPYQSRCTGGHGSNEYWGGQGGEACRWGLPSSSSICGNNQIIGSVCYSPTSTCTTYGYASDFSYPTFVCNQPVFLPYLNGQKLTWTRRWTYSSSMGFGGMMSATDGTNTYEMYMTHLNAFPNPGESGSIAGTLFCGIATPHVHVELRINGQYIRPDFLCAGGGGPIPSSTPRPTPGNDACGDLNGVCVPAASCITGCGIAAPSGTCSSSQTCCDLTCP